VVVWNAELGWRIVLAARTGELEVQVPEACAGRGGEGRAEACLLGGAAPCGGVLWCAARRAGGEGRACAGCLGDSRRSVLTHPGAAALPLGVR